MKKFSDTKMYEDTSKTILQTKNRDMLLDSLKGFLMILVLIGHIGGDNTRSNVYLQSIEVFIYLFHMPLFVFISGYFSKNLESDTNKSFKNIFLLYIVFQILYGIWTVVLHNNWQYLKNPFYPGPALWYILALFIWKKFLPDLLKIKHILIVSVIFSILSAFTSGLNSVYCSIGRIIAFLPYFLLGYYMKRENIDRIREKLPKLLAIAIIIGGLFFSFVFITRSGIRFDQIINILCHRVLVFEVSGGIFYATCINILLIPIAIVLSASVIKLIPESKVLSYIGRDTLPIYLCHPYIQEVIRVFQTKIFFVKNDYINYGMSLIFVLIILLVLTSKFFKNLFYKILGKIKKIIFEEEQV